MTASAALACQASRQIVSAFPDSASRYSKTEAQCCCSFMVNKRRARGQRPGLLERTMTTRPRNLAANYAQVDREGGPFACGGKRTICLPPLRLEITRR